MRTPAHRWAVVLSVAAALLLSSCGASVTGTPLGMDASASSTAGAAAGTEGTSSTDAQSSADGDAGSSGTDVSRPGSGVVADVASGAWPESSLDDGHLVQNENVSTTWDVTPKEDAVILGYDFAEEALLDYDAAAGRWEFQPGAVTAAGLAEGDAILVAGRGMGRISTMTDVDGRIVVQTSEASLADIIEDGTMAWDATVDFGEAWAVDDSPAGLRSPRQAGAFAVDSAGNTLRTLPRDKSDGLTKWEYKDGDTKYLFQITPGATSTDVIIQVTRDELTFTAKGTVGSLHSAGSATFKGGKLASTTVDNGGLGGNITLKMAAASTVSTSGELKMDVPGLMFKYIVPVGPVPITMGITAQVIGSVDLPVKASVLFESNFAYTGQAGFKYTGSDVQATGQLGNMVMDPKGADPVGFIGSMVDAQFGVSFPKVSLSIFETGLVPSLQPAIYLGTQLTWGPVCKTAYIRAELRLGYDLKALGVSFAKGSEVIWDKRRDTKADGCE